LGQANSRIAQLFLRYGQSAAGLRHVPVLGSCLSWIGRKVVPRDALTWVQVRSGPAAGIWLRLNPRTGRDVVEGGGEPQVQEVLSARLAPGTIFYDVGANIGFFSLLAARLVGPNGRVVAFEADPENASRLREHAERNAFTWLSVEEKAVWSKSGNVAFARCDPAASPDRGLGSVVDSDATGTIRVDAVSLDDCALRFPPPDWIKCDVEGAEVEVFRGARRLLSEKCPMVICEMHSEENRSILVENFSQLGYRCVDCDERHVLAVPQMTSAA
jgi:FkbM family methyltransferase